MEERSRFRFIKIKQPGTFKFTIKVVELGPDGKVKKRKKSKKEKRRIRKLLKLKALELKEEQHVEDMSLLRSPRLKALIASGRFVHLHGGHATELPSDGVRGRKRKENGDVSVRPSYRKY